MKNNDKNKDKLNKKNQGKPMVPFVDPDLLSREVLPSEAPKLDDEIEVNIKEKNVDSELKIEIAGNESMFEPPREYVQSSLAFRNKLKFLVVVFVAIATVIAGAMIIYDTLSDNQKGDFSVKTSNSDKSMVVTFSESEMAIRSEWSNSESLAYIAKTTSSSLGFELEKVVLCNRDEQRSSMPKVTKVISDISKSITPVTFYAPNSETVGINDGWDNAVKITAGSHNLKEIDIGSVFSDASNRQFTVVKIIDGNSFLVHPSLSEYSKSGFKFALPSSPLSYVSGKVNRKTVKFEKAEKSDLYPVFSKVSREITADSQTVDVSKQGHTVCSNFTVKISFDIINLRSCLKYLESNAGNNNNSSYYSDAISDKCLAMTYIYTFSRNGSCTVKVKIEAKTDLHLTSVNGPVLPVKKINNVEYLYIPNAKNLNSLGAQVRKYEEIGPDKWSDPKVAPYRFYEFETNELSSGICAGYCPDTEASATDTRLSLVSFAAKLDFDNSIIRPYIVSKDISVKKDDKYEYISFIAPFEKNTTNFSDKDLSAICWYWVNDDIYLMLDSHKSIDKNISLPSYMNGMKVTPVDLDENTVVDTQVVTNKTIHVNISSEYGYAVLKLTKQ